MSNVLPIIGPALMFLAFCGAALLVWIASDALRTDDDD